MPDQFPATGQVLAGPEGAAPGSLAASSVNACGLVDEGNTGSIADRSLEAPLAVATVAGLVLGAASRFGLAAGSAPGRADNTSASVRDEESVVGDVD